MAYLKDSDDDEQYLDDEEMSDDSDDDVAGVSDDISKRPAIYNVEALHDKLEDIAWSNEQDWMESLAITGAEAFVVEDAEDDLARELAFYNQALDAAKQARQRFEDASVPWQRPADYYAEMVKSDEHMAKVKQQLMFEQQQIEQAEERRKQREAKKYSKQVQAEKKKERAASKKAAIGNIETLRKQRKQQGFSGELDFDVELDRMNQDMLKPDRAGARIQQGQRNQNKKRAFKDSKYGFGGRKKLKKQNDAKSAADMSTFNRSSFVKGNMKRKGGGGAGGGGGPGKGKAKGKPNRPGKSRRNAQRGKK